MDTQAIIKNRIVVSNVAYTVAVVVAALLMRPDADVPINSLAQMLGTVAAVFGLFNIGLAVAYGTAFPSWKALFRANAVLIALLVWILLFAGTMAIAAAMVDPEALMGVAMLIPPTAFLLVAVATNVLISYAAPKLLAKR